MPKMVYMVLQPKSKTIRYVTVPKQYTRSETLQALEDIFFFGQNDIQQRDGCPSVSMGDIAIVDGTYWICEHIGWTNLA